MDSDEIEKNRGITIFADQGCFTYADDIYYIIDTPGHVDFSAETERSISAMDYAILLVSGSAGVQAHTTALFKMLLSYKIPTFFFINKADMENFCLETILDEIKNKLTKDILSISSMEEILEGSSAEYAAERDENFLEAFLNEDYTAEKLKDILIMLIQEQRCFPVMHGSALKGMGIDGFIDVFSKLSETSYDEKAESAGFVGKVYKIRHDDNKNRLAFIKALSGRLKIKDEFLFEQDGRNYEEKINEIRIYNGKRYENKNSIEAGDVFAVTGLSTPVCGTVLEAGKLSETFKESYYFASALQSKVIIEDGTDKNALLEKLRILEAEDPLLSVTFNRESGEIIVNLMGKIQLEILQQILETRFSIRVSFEKPKVQYRETITKPVVGYGHFEPLRHYAEVQLRLEPGKRGEGITFESECHVDILDLNFQRLIKSHVFEKAHKGVLTGSPITDIMIILQNGRAHIKHTDGGDFREATFRAIRQGLEKAESLVLEPFYRFEIFVEDIYLGRVFSDIQKLRGSFEPPVQNNGTVIIRGRGPVETFMDYGTELVSFTRGKGNISLLFEGYDICGNSDEVIEKTGYKSDRDIENTSSSVFCSKGTSFVVKWDEAENYMHTIE